MVYFFIWEKNKGKKLKDILKFFESKHLLPNDHIVNLLIQKNFKTTEKVIDKPFLRKQIAREMGPL